MEPVNQDDVEWIERDDERYGVRRQKLAAAADGEQLGCSRYELPPGNRAWPYHYHTGNEEAIYVLSGTGTLRLDGEEYGLESGDYVALPAGEESAHQVINPGDEPIEYLVFSTMDEPEVLGYPDSGKVGVMAGGAPGGESERYLEGYFPLESEVDYWDGE